MLIDDPQAFQKVRDIKRLFPLQEVQFQIGLRDDIERILSTLGAESTTDGRKEAVNTLLGLNSSERASRKESATAEELDENNNMIVRLVNQMIFEAHQMGASDIHVEPYGEKHGSHPLSR